ELWTAKVEDYKKGYYMSLAPLVVDGRVMIGMSGGELGVRGFVAAYDEQGKDLWRTFMVPAPGEPGSETWPQGDQWKTGGASGWGPPAPTPGTPPSPSGPPEGAARGGATTPRATPSPPPRWSRSTPRRAPSRDISSITKTIQGTGMKSPRRSWSTIATAGE